VVVTTFNHAHFLGSALDSVVSQTFPAHQLIVVDDGSQDNPAEAVAKVSQARLITQPNRGLAAARNAGLEAAESDFVLFLDADDVLCPTAIEAAVAAMQACPGAALVYGAYMLADSELAPTSEPQFRPFGASAYHALLRDNLIGMHGAVLYDRAKLLDAGGFDESLSRCEDYDVYLRLAHSHPIACHPEVVAIYRMHGANMTSDPVAMLRSALEVHARHRPPAEDLAAVRAWQGGRRFLTVTHVNQAWKNRHELPLRARQRQRRALLRSHPGASIAAAAWQGAKRILPRPAALWLRRRLERSWVRVGGVDMGHLARTQPLSRKFGFDRGTPVDRYYIESFLAENAGAIGGRVLEVGDAHYTRRFGRGVTAEDVLHVSPESPEATIVGDLSQPSLLPEAAFDCLIVTQTLNLIYDMGAAVAAMHRALKPGGTLLLTVPGVSSIERGEWTDQWMWSLTVPAAETLFAGAFRPENLTVRAYGNVYAATCFLHGLALEEVRRDWLDRSDPFYPVIVSVRARRAG